MSNKPTNKIIAYDFSDDDVKNFCEKGMDIREEHRAILSNQRVMTDILRKIAKGADREKIADLCHRQWSGWMKYLFEKSKETPDGSVVIPRTLVERWWRQIETDYKDLPEEEKDSDRKEADKFILLMK